MYIILVQKTQKTQKSHFFQISFHNYKKTVCSIVLKLYLILLYQYIYAMNTKNREVLSIKMSKPRSYPLFHRILNFPKFYPQAFYL